MCMLRAAAGVGLKATDNLHEWRTHFQFPPVTNCKFHFYRPSFPIKTTWVSPQHHEDLLSQRHPSFPLGCLCLTSLQSSEHAAMDGPAPCPLRTLPLRTLPRWQTELHSGRPEPQCQSCLCPCVRDDLSLGLSFPRWGTQDSRLDKFRKSPSCRFSDLDSSDLGTVSASVCHSLPRFLL